MDQPDIQVPEWLRSFVVGVNVLVLHGLPYPYLVIDRKLERKLPGFVSFNNGLLFVSDEVRADFREFFLLHEIFESLEPKDSRGRCRNALLQELARVPPEIRNTYIAYREEFFRRLVLYYEDGDKRGTPEFRTEIAGSLAYLRSLH